MTSRFRRLPTTLWALWLALLLALVPPATATPAPLPAGIAHTYGVLTQAWLDALPAPAETRTATPGAQSLETVLTADGRLRAGVQGSFDATGFSMTLGPDGAPRFAAAAALAPPGSGAYSGNFASNFPDASVRAIAVSGSDMYVGGEFGDVGGVAGTGYVARWDGSAWNALGAGVSGSVNALAVSGSDVYVGGGFTTAYDGGGAAVAGTARVARWDGTAWNSLADGVNSIVRALAIGTAPDAEPSGMGAPVAALFLGGDFTSAADGTPAGRFTYFTQGASLPVELAAFAARADGASARLAWTTASETNNAGFLVEQQNGQTWTQAAPFVAGHGTTTERHDYAAVVTGLTPGRHTFRLRQTDTDGAVHYSGVVTVEIGSTDGLSLRVLSNGGAAPRVAVAGVVEGAPARLRLYDVLGRQVHEALVEGAGVEVLPALATGAYVVRVEQAGRVATARLLVVR